MFRSSGLRDCSDGHGANRRCAGSDLPYHPAAHRKHTFTVTSPTQHADEDEIGGYARFHTKNASGNGSDAVLHMVRVHAHPHSRYLTDI